MSDFDPKKEADDIIRVMSEARAELDRLASENARLRSEVSRLRGDANAQAMLDATEAVPVACVKCGMPTGKLKGRDALCFKCGTVEWERLRGIEAAALHLTRTWFQHNFDAYPAVTEAARALRDLAWPLAALSPREPAPTQETPRDE